MKLFVRITPIWLFLDKTYPTRTNKRKDYSFTLFEKLMMGENKEGNFTKRGEITECYFYLTLSINMNFRRPLKFKIIEKGLMCNFIFQLSVLWNNLFNIVSSIVIRYIIV